MKETLKEYMERFQRKFADFQQEVVDGITPQHSPQEATRSDACSHVVTFGPTWHVQPGTHVHVLSGKPADVVDMTCPDCGTKLFIYYRALSAEKE